MTIDELLLSYSVINMPTDDHTHYERVYVRVLPKDRAILRLRCRCESHYGKTMYHLPPDKKCDFCKYLDEGRIRVETFYAAGNPGLTQTTYDPMREGDTLRPIFVDKSLLQELEAKRFIER